MSRLDNIIDGLRDILRIAKEEKMADNDYPLSKCSDKCLEKCPENVKGLGSEGCVRGCPHHVTITSRGDTRWIDYTSGSNVSNWCPVYRSRDVRCCPLNEKASVSPTHTFCSYGDNNSCSLNPSYRTLARCGKCYGAIYGDDPRKDCIYSRDGYCSFMADPVVSFGAWCVGCPHRQVTKEKARDGRVRAARTRLQIAAIEAEKSIYYFRGGSVVDEKGIDIPRIQNLIDVHKATRDLIRKEQAYGEHTLSGY